MSDALPLAGLRVLDLTRLLPGPLATKHLADLGAEVIKIEGPLADGQGDGMRAIGRSADDAAAGRPSLAFRELNAGKTLLEIDLRAPAGRERLLSMAREADLVIEGFRPGVMARLGLGPEVLHAVNPKLVVCAISGYGQASAPATTSTTSRWPGCSSRSRRRRASRRCRTSRSAT